MVDKTVITEYLNNFRRYLSKYLKSGVGVQTISYPFDKGAIIVIELGMGVPTKDDSRSQSLDLKEALTRTNLFENINDVPEIPGTSILLLKNKIVLLKTDKLNQWGEGSAQTDVTKIINTIQN